MGKYELMVSKPEEGRSSGVFFLNAFGMLVGIGCICLCTVIFNMHHNAAVKEYKITIGRQEKALVVVRTENSNLAETLNALNELAEAADKIVIPKMTRGMRNKNPLNVVAMSDKNAWFGQIGRDETNHAIFRSYEHGIRAGFLVLKKFYEDRELDTPAAITARFCEGNADKYAKHIGERLGIGPKDKFDVMHRMPELLKAMIEFENGFQPFPDSMFVPYYRR